MSAPKLLFKPRFTPIPPDIDIPRLVHTTPNFHWCHREDSRLHAAPFHKLNQIIYTVNIEQGLPIVVDNWHLRNDWNGSLFSKEWLDREHGSDGMLIKGEDTDGGRNCGERFGEGTGYSYVNFVLFVTGPDLGWPGFRDGEE
jgi:hypothetical protein